MQLISGIFFALALILAVSLGGQTLDYTWGPALIVLSAALAAMIPRAWMIRFPGRGPQTF